VTFEIAPADLYMIGSFTIVVNGIMGVAGLVMPAGLPAPPVPAPESTDTAEDES